MAAAGTALLWLVIVVAAVSGGGDDGSTDDQLNAATETPDVTAEATPAPTDATDTLTLTPTPEPTLPQLTAAECSYISQVGQQASDFADGLGGLGDVAGRSDLFSQEWIIDLAVQLVILDLVADEAIALEAPSSLDDVQDEWVAVAQKLKQVVDLMTEGVDEVDAGKIDQASNLMLEVSVDTPAIAVLVDEFAASRSGQC